MQVLPAVTPKIPELIPYPNTSDQFLIVGSFSDTSGIAEGSIIPTVGPVRILRIQIEEEVDHWVALSEVCIYDFFCFSWTAIMLLTSIFLLITDICICLIYHVVWQDSNCKWNGYEEKILICFVIIYYCYKCMIC